MIRCETGCFQCSTCLSLVPHTVRTHNSRYGGYYRTACSVYTNSGVVMDISTHVGVGSVASGNAFPSHTSPHFLSLFPSFPPNLFLFPHLSLSLTLSLTHARTPSKPGECNSGHSQSRHPHTRRMCTIQENGESSPLSPPSPVSLDHTHCSRS